MSSPKPPAGDPRRVALISLGCPKNQVDSELMLGRLRADGHELVDDPEEADTLLINTCAFIDRARAESVEALLDAASWKGARAGREVVAAGCLVQRHGEELAAEMPELDALVGLDELAEVSRKLSPLPALPAAAARGALPSHPGEAPASDRPRRTASAGAAIGLFDARDPRVRMGPRHSAYVKIAEGCDQSCAFCAIPTFRGKMRSRSLADLGAELSALAREGVVEANLIAQDSTGYGRDLGEREGLAELVRSIDALDEAPVWVRLHYLYPGRITRSFLDAAARSERLVSYVDLPLQHAHADVLRRMRRPGHAESYLRQLEALRSALPDAGVRSGFIVGFPGESEAHFEELCAFVEEAGFDAVGVFTYSHEQETHALAFEDDVPADVKEERRRTLEEIAAAASEERNRARVGRVLEVLLEGPAEDAPEGLRAPATGRWEGQAPEVDGRVIVEGAAELPAGSFVRALVVDAAPHELVARLEDASGATPAASGAPPR